MGIEALSESLALDFVGLTSVVITLFQRRQKTAYPEMNTGTHPGTVTYYQPNKSDSALQHEHNT